MKRVLLAMLVIGWLATHVRAEDVATPPDGLRPPVGQQDPRYTYQRWELGQNPTSPVESRNPFGQAQISWSNGQWPATAPGWGFGPTYPTIRTLHIGDYLDPSHPHAGYVDITVPNTPDGVKKTVFVQITSDKATDPDGPEVVWPSGPGWTSSSHPGSTLPQLGNGWYVYNDVITIQPNPQYEVIRYWFPDSTDIAEIVVDTRCEPVPEPATFVLLAIGGVAIGGCALVRRRRRTS
jgi:hypothetical protein